LDCKTISDFSETLNMTTRVAVGPRNAGHAPTSHMTILRRHTRRYSDNLTILCHVIGKSLSCYLERDIWSRTSVLLVAIAWAAARFSLESWPSEL